MAEGKESDTKKLDSTSNTENGNTDDKRKLLFQPLPENYHFHQLLLEIGREIDSDTLENIKSIYQSELKEKLCEKITHPRELFRILYQRGFVVPENMIHLQGIVVKFSDLDIKTKLMKRIHEFSDKHRAVYYRPITDEPANGYRRFRCHLKGLEHYQLQRKHVEGLIGIVSDYAGVDRGKILVDGIEITNSIYVSLSIPAAFYIVFESLLQSGSPLWDSNVDMVTFDDGTTIEVLTGKKVKEDLPPVYESPEEKIQKLKQILEVVQMENIDYKKENECLSAMLKLYNEEESTDVEVTLQRFVESMQEAEHRKSDRELLQRLIQFNTQLVKGLEKKKRQAEEKRLRSELEFAKTELIEYKHALTVGEPVKCTGDDYKNEKPEVNQQKAKETTAPESTPSSFVFGEKTTQAESNLDDALKRAEDLGYSKEVIRQIVVSNATHERNSTRREFEAERVLLEERISVLNSLLQLTIPSHGFKQSLMKQLETVFRSRGEEIPVDRGYRKGIMQLAMDLSSLISTKEQQALESGYKDVPVTVELKQNRKLLLLRLLYLENLNSDLLVLIEEFISKKLTSVGRADLNKKWREYAIPRNEMQQLQQQELQQVLVRDGAFELRPEAIEVLGKLNAKVTDNEKKVLRKKLPARMNCPDQALLHTLVRLNLQNVHPNTENFLRCVKDLLKEIQRQELYQEFEKEYIDRCSALQPPMKDLVRRASERLSHNKKRKLRKNLQNPEKCKDENDVLECMTMEHFKDKEITIEKISGFMKKVLEDMHEKGVYDQFVKELQANISISQTFELRLPIMHPLQQESNNMVLQKLQELSNKIDSMQYQRTSLETKFDITNQSAIRRSANFTDEELLREFFTSKMYPQQARGSFFRDMSPKSNPVLSQYVSEAAGPNVK